MKQISSDQRGAVLVTVIIVLPALLLIAFNYTSLAANNFRVSVKDQLQTKAQLVADAGIDYGMQQLNINTSWTGTGEIDAGGNIINQEVLFDINDNVRTTYQIDIIDVDEDKKIMNTTARLYKPASSETPERSITIRNELRPVTAGDFSVVTGVGGLVMENSAKILGGNVFVNGTISMSGSSQIGLSISPITLSVANQVCPLEPDATYPRLCASGENDNPIRFETGQQQRIYGSVSANYQQPGYEDDKFVAPGGGNGIIARSGVQPQPLPTHDRAAQKAAIASEQTGAQASCTQNKGSKTWPANVKINGNVLVERGCRVTLEGNAWITGTLTLVTGGILRPSDALGTTRADVMVDGDKIMMRNNESGIEDNSSNTGIQLINYFSTAPCSPDCTEVTGEFFKTSRDYPTIDIDNKAFGPSTSFYAKWTKIDIKNSGQLGALVGQTIAIRNSGTITFGTAAGTGTEFWVIDNYRRVFN